MKVTLTPLVARAQEDVRNRQGDLLLASRALTHLAVRPEWVGDHWVLHLQDGVELVVGGEGEEG